MTYDNIHRFLLRTMANRGVLSMTQSLIVLKEFTGQNKSDKDILKLVNEINTEISSFKQKITIVNDKNTESSENSLIFINLVADKATKAQNIFKENECKYFMKLIDEIIFTESRELKYATAISIVNQFKFTIKEAKGLIDRWCKLFYLKKITREDILHITLGLRGIYEFKAYFTDNMKDLVKNCEKCKEIVIVGCQCTKCGKALHNPCLDIHMESKHGNITNSDVDVDLPEDQQDDSNMSTDREEELLKSDSDTDGPVPRKRCRVRSDSEEMLTDSSN